MSTPTDPCITVKETAKEEILDIDGVTGIGVENHPRSGHGIVIYTEHHQVEIPQSIEGLSVRRRVSGVIRSFGLVTKYPVVHPFPQDDYNYPVVRPLSGQQLVVHPLDVYSRPVLGGNSVSSYSSRLAAYVTGTVGMLVQDAAGASLIMSDNHVLAGISTVQNGGGIVNTPLFQPGAYYGGSANVDTFAHLSRWTNIDETGANEVDLAFGAPDLTQVAPGILNIGVPMAIADPSPGMTMQKMGALSGLTQGFIADTNATISVDYEGLFTATFDNQIVIDQIGNSPPAIPGDSGSISVVVDSGGKPVAVGLIFSGGTGLAVANKMTVVQQMAGLTLPVGTLTVTGAGGGTTGVLTAALILAGVGAASWFLVRR